MQRDTKLGKPGARRSSWFFPWVIAIAGVAGIPIINAQTPRSCATMIEHAAQLAQNPGYAAAQQSIEAATAAFVAQGGNGGADVVRRIPVVVHIVHNTPAQNLSDAQVQSQIQVLNEDFRRANTDAASTLAGFVGVASDTEIEFCLATLNPQGQPSTGITRRQTSVTAFAQSGNPVKFTAQGGTDAWPRDQYLNIWVCNLSGGLLGYAQFPGGTAATDGVVNLFSAFGRNGTAVAPFNLGRTCTHEVGHWLNLRHVWGDAQPSCGDDLVADTPPANTPHFGCPLNATSCGGTNMVQNYMDYSDDGCMNLYTLGQKHRMQALFNAGGARAALLTSPAACPTTPVIGPYQVNQPISTLLINGLAGTAAAPAITTVASGTAVTIAFQSNAAGLPFDTFLSLGAAVPVGSGAYVTPGSQIVNLSPFIPYVFVNSGTPAPSPVAFPGNFSISVTPLAAGTATAQLAMVTPILTDGYALSQPCQLTATAPPPPCTITLPQGPGGDDSSATVTLSGAGGCSTTVPFYGTSYTRFFVISNGRITFQSADLGFAPSPAVAASGIPFAGFWTDLDPSTGGSIQITQPGTRRFRTAFNNVRYYGESASNTFAIEIDGTNGVVTLDALATIVANPRTTPIYNGQHQFLGISRGSGATTPAVTTFAPGGAGAPPNATDMIYDFYNSTQQNGGLCTSLLGPLNRLTFTPAANGNYAWAGQ